MKEKNKILLAGPWIGEFGWELFCWQGYVRFHSDKFDKVKIIGRPGHRILYEDFCDEYIEFDPCSFNTDMFMCHGSKTYNHLLKEIPHTHYLDGQFNIGIQNTIKGLIDRKNIFFKEQKFKKYKSDSLDYSFDIIFHCRNKTVGPERNWSKSQWVDLYEELKSDYNIACIGNDESFYIDGTKDLRNISLSDLCSVFNRSKLIVGPSSGPMHLASLCGLKHLVWSTEYNKVRYERDWNPLNTEVIFYDKEGWNPSPSKIKDIITNII